jgi:hypothetical protein
LLWLDRFYSVKHFRGAAEAFDFNFLFAVAQYAPELAGAIRPFTRRVCEWHAAGTAEGVASRHANFYATLLAGARRILGQIHSRSRGGIKQGETVRRNPFA